MTNRPKKAEPLPATDADIIVLTSSNTSDDGRFFDGGHEMRVGPDISPERAFCLIQEGRAFDKAKGLDAATGETQNNQA